MITLFNQASQRFKIIHFLLSIPAITLLFVAGCEPKEEVDPVVQNDRIELINDEVELNRDLVLLNDTIEVRNMTSFPSTRIAQNFDLILVAQINSSSVDGYQLQSTSVELDCEKAVIGFNVAGDPYKGGIKIVTTDECIKISSSIDFNDADIHNVHLTEDYVYAATGTSNWVDDQTAVLEIFTINGDKLSIENTSRIGLGSYAANSVITSKYNIYVTTGDNENIGGGIYKINLESLQIDGITNLHDARWMDICGDQIFIVQGTPGKYSVIDLNSLNVDHEVSVNGMNFPEAKSTIDISGKMAFIAAGSAGVQIFNTVNHSLIGEIPVPDPSNPDMLTNAVAYDEGLLFISNGAGGVYVANVLTDVNENASTCETELLGYLDFESMASVNHIAFKGEYLFIAAGLDGIKIVKVVRN